MKKTTLTILLLFFIAFSFGQTVIYQEDFTGQDGKGAIGPTPTIDTTGVTWTVDVSAASLTASSDWFMVNNEMMEARDVDGKSIWFSPVINIAGYTNVEFVMQAFESGTMEASDYIKTEMRIDGGIWFQVAVDGNLFDDFTSGEPSQSGITGSTMEIRVTAENNAGSEYIRFDNVLVKGILANTNNNDSELLNTSQPPSSVIQSTDDTPAEAVYVFSMTLKDQGSGDGLPTKLTNVHIVPAASNTADFANTIQGVVIDDGVNFITPSAVSITSAGLDISFNVGDYDIPDGTTRDFNLSIYLNTTNILDNSILSFKVQAVNHGFTADNTGSDFADPFPGGDFVSNDFTIDVKATEMQFFQQPTDVVENTIMTPAVVVAYTDENGNVDMDYDGLGVTATLSENGALFAATVTTTGTPVNGIMTFNDIEFVSPASLVTITVIDNGTVGAIINPAVTSNYFDVLAPMCNFTQNVVVASQNFETPPPTPELVYTATNANLVTGNGAFPNDPKYVSANNGIEVNNATGEIIFGPIDTSNMANINFSIRLASFAGTSGNGSDPGDTVTISVKDDIAAYTDELQVKGNGNARWSFISGTGTAQGSYDGDNNPVIFQPAGGGNRTSDGYTKLMLQNLPVSTNLFIKITAINNHANEFWVFDDATLSGDVIQSTTWNGTSWSNGVPNNVTKAIIAGNYNMTSNPSFEACACEIKSGVQLKIDNGKSIIIGNDIVNNGTISVASEGSIIQKNQNVITSGTDFRIEKITTPYRMYDYTYWSSPIENADIATVFAANPLSYIYDFNTANFSDTDNDSFDDNGDDWQHASGTMTVGKGYITMGEGAQFPVPNPIPTTTQQQTVLFTGKINNGDIFVPVSLDANSSDSYINQNLIGNPYPSAISAPAFLTKNSNLAGTLYFWTHNDQISSTNSGPDTYNFTNDSYVTYVAGSGGALGNCGGCAVPTDYIASGQGFFADLSQSAGNGTVVFTNAMRSDQNNNFYRTPQNEKNRIWFNMTTDTNDFRQILIGFFDEATNDDDRDYDGKRLINGNNFDFYSLIDNQKYAVQGVPTLIDTKTIPVGVEIITDCQVTFSIDRFEGDLDQVNVYLHDMNLGIYHDLKQANYVIDMLQGEYANRFEMVFSRNALNLNNQVLTDKNKLIVANHNDQVLVKVLGNHTMKQIDVYDVIGKLITSVSVDTNEINLNDNYKSGAVYFVKVRLNNGQKISKKFLKL